MRGVNRRGLVLVLALGPVMAACGADRFPVAGDRRYDGPCSPGPACDIRDPACQDRIFRATACTREQSGATPPPVRTLTVPELEAELRAMSAASPTGGPWTTAFRLLGLLPPGTALDEALIQSGVDGIAAYYDTETGGISVVDRDAPGSAEEDLFVLSHEFVHALQDATVDLDALRTEWVTSTDADVAVTSLVEGEATVLAEAVLARSLGTDPAFVDWDRLAVAFRTSIFLTIEASDAPFFTAIQSLPYPVGMELVAGPWLAGGQAAIDALYEAPATSLLELMPEADPKAAVEPIDCYPTAGPAGLAPWDHDRLGPTGPFALEVGLGGNADLLWKDRATAWRNDTVVVFAPADPAVTAPTAVAWKTHWASEADAAAFEAGIRSGLDATTTRVAVFGRDVLVYGSTDPALLTAWDPAAACGTESDLPAAPQGASPMQAVARIRATRAP